MKKIKRINSDARLLGLDLGRKYVGVAVSDRQLINCKPYKTYQIDPQLFKQSYDFGQSSSFFNALRILIRSKQVKGLVIGYPLTAKNEYTLQCQYVEKFVEYMWSEQKLRVPVTLVNEYNSSMEAKAKIAHIVSNSMGLTAEQKLMNQLRGPDEDNTEIANALPLQSQVHSLGEPGQFAPEVMLRKGIYDKVASQIIL